MSKQFKLLSKNAILPQRATRFSAGYDISASETVTIEPHTIGFVPTGLAARMNFDDAMLLLDRSSNPIKKGIRLANSVGLIDKDFYPNEFKGVFENFTDEPVTIEKGDRIMQAVFIKFGFTVDDKPGKLVRESGFGSTGK